MRVPILLLLSFCSVAFGQLDSNSITVTASNNPTLQADQALFSLSVQSGTNTSLDDVVAALQGVGVTAANFASLSTLGQDIVPVSNGFSPQPGLYWTFNLSVPIANIKATIASLATIQQNLTKQNNGLMLSFSIFGTQVSQQLAQSQTCSFSALIAAATAQAQTTASASGMTLGSILALSSSTASSSGGTGIASSQAAPCSVKVKFNASRY